MIPPRGWCVLPEVAKRRLRDNGSWLYEAERGQNGAEKMADGSGEDKDRAGQPSGQLRINDRRKE